MSIPAASYITVSKSRIVESLLSWADSGIVANKKIQAEKQKVIKEKKRADSKRAKAEELRELVEINQKKAMDEKCRADNLSQQVEEHRQGIERLRKEIDELVSLRKLVEAPDDLSDKCMNDETAKVKGGFPAGKSSAAEESKLADIERKKVEENLIQLEKLKREADNARSKLVLETFKSEEANKKIEAEKKKVITEKKHADSEMAKAEELRKFAEINQKKVMDEKCRADYLSQQVEEHRQRIGRLQRDIDELVPLRKFVEAPDKCMNAEALEVKGGLRTEILEREADESKLVLEYLNSEQVNKRLKEEKQR
ncbi:trichoplein keratin filament-binding protein-like [Camellia sinensis]|uniref:trichoplein keratin filament-binding protein-like n=1 Tax=Camellia sinensis TaxID=4442 RepID=UPI001035DD06|nr:trichoplein keratin filament-binding protein-like [Camellia sinensis]